MKKSYCNSGKIQRLTTMMTVFYTTVASMQWTLGPLTILAIKLDKQPGGKSFPRDNIKPGPCIGRSIKSVCVNGKRKGGYKSWNRPVCSSNCSHSNETSWRKRWQKAKTPTFFSCPPIRQSSRPQHC